MLGTLRPAALVMIALATILPASACGSFGSEDPPGVANDGGAQPVAPRDVRVEIDWPSVAQLDPSADPRASKLRVTITDATDASRKTERSAAKAERGPFDFPQLSTSSLIDVVVELTGADGRLLGYGEARRWDLARATTVSVALRRRLVYFINGDRDAEQLRVLDLAPAARGEPAIDEGPAELPSLLAATALTMTADGRLLVESGKSATGGALAVFETSTNQRTKVIDLAFLPDVIVPIGDGRKVLAFPGDQATTAQLARVDVDSGAVEDLPSGFQGGKLVVRSATRSPDGARIVAAATYQASPNGAGKAYLLAYDTAAGTTTAIDVPDVHVASAVRFTPDGAGLLVAGYATPTPEDASTGVLFTYDAAPTTPKTRIVMAANVTRPTSLVVHPNGVRAYVSTATMYPSGACCADFHVFDLRTGQESASYPMTGNGPEYDFTSALRLPYAPFRVLVGQSDPGNNVHAPIVELSADADRPVDLDVNASGIGTIRAMAAPFAQSL